MTNNPNAYPNCHRVTTQMQLEMMMMMMKINSIEQASSWAPDSHWDDLKELTEVWIPPILPNKVPPDTKTSFPTNRELLSPSGFKMLITEPR